MSHQLRDNQFEAVDDLRAAYRKGYRAPLLVMPTGSGKTHVFTYIATEAEKRGFRVLIIVHRSYLWKQCSNKINDIGKSHGIIAPGHTNIGHKIQIASIDTLVRRLHSIIPPDLIIFDEGHHVWGKNKWGKVLSFFPNARVLGVTATACRTSGQGLGINSGGHYDILVPGPSGLDLTPEYLTPYKLFAPDIGVDMTGVRRIAGDYDKKETIKRVDLKSIYGNIPAHYKKICPGIPAIAFCVSVKHAEHVSEEFNSWGISSASVSGKTSEKQREYLFNGLASGKFSVLCSCDLVSEGFDVPVCGCAILLRPTQSLVLYLQQCGRTTRISDGKEFAYIIDHVGNSRPERHGFPDKERVWSLDGIMKNKLVSEASISIRTCLQCFHVHPPAPKCPECGYVYTTGFKLPPTNEDIKLKEMETARQQKQEKIAIRKKEQASCNTLDSLKAYAASKRYKAGYVKHIWNARLTKFHTAENINDLYKAAKLIDFPDKDVRREWDLRQLKHANR
jgi:DNA repair protein RadD